MNEEDEFLYGNETIEQSQVLADRSASDSDSDLEVIIDLDAGKKAEPPAQQARQGIRMVRPDGTGTKALKQPEAVRAATPPPGVEIDRVGLLDGKQVTLLNLEDMDDKGWRKPGADITDYFNYGFDEFTWAAYCMKQTTLRQDYNPAKVMAGMCGMDPSMMMGPMPTDLMMAAAYPPMHPEMLMRPPDLFPPQMPLPPPQPNLNLPQRQMAQPQPAPAAPPPPISSVAGAEKVGDSTPQGPPSFFGTDFSGVPTGPSAKTPRGPRGRRGRFP